MVRLLKQQRFLFLPHLVALALICASKAVGVSFQQNYKVTWGKNHVFFLDNGSEVQLSFDKTSAYFKGLGTFGRENHDEIDFELLGNKGRAYTLQTNVFVSDEGGREQRHSLWFDPTVDFHTYGILWNQHQIVFYVDETPIRIFKNRSNIGVRFPSHQMQVKVSIWNGEPWASNGKKIDWKQGPFLAQFQGFNIHGCQLQNHNKYNCYSPHLWWNSKKYWELNPQEQREYENVRRKHLLYDYCSDRGQLHKECQIR
ncbi:unnamed protein product [Trifolium pratense]|uniref:Uncharacterized protein n=1 Tax=Trifolium pratense TaxID=57577 RepID=A0ACB0LN25_TRIPR|nr:unnamed protein product [Trifolium pratense]